MTHTKERLYSDCTGVEMGTRRVDGSRRSLIQGEGALVQGAIPLFQFRNTNHLRGLQVGLRS
jgi:hypothetical protein